LAWSLTARALKDQLINLVRAYWRNRLNFPIPYSVALFDHNVSY
jgi:hypothetical protein